MNKVSEKEKSVHLKKAEDVVARLAVEVVDEATLIELVRVIFNDFVYGINFYLIIDK
jgi:hypothetical protein